LAPAPSLRLRQGYERPYIFMQAFHSRQSVALKFHRQKGHVGAFAMLADHFRSVCCQSRCRSAELLAIRNHPATEKHRGSKTHYCVSAVSALVLLNFRLLLVSCRRVVWSACVKASRQGGLSPQTGLRTVPCTWPSRTPLCAEFLFGSLTVPDR